MATALLLGADTPVRASAQAALRRGGWDILHAGGVTSGDSAPPDSRLFDALVAASAPHLVVVVADLSGDAPLLELEPARLRELEAQVLVASWEALREAARVFAAPGSAVLLVAPVASGVNSTGAFAAAAQRALRTMIASAAVEFSTRDAPIRVNLLEYDARGFGARAFERALVFLGAPASSFMTGTHLALSAAPPASGGDPP